MSEIAKSGEAPIRLDHWVSNHGPLWPATALVIILDACATASRLSDQSLRDVIVSLNPAGVIRRSDGWRWIPTATAGDDHPVGDHEIIERLGAILFCALSGHAQLDALASEPALRATLRASQPGLSTTIVELTLGALSVRHRRSITLAAFAGELRQALGCERQTEPRLSRMTLAKGSLAAALLSAAWWSLAESDTGRGSHALTMESIRQDITYEFATTDALIDEHTMAIRLYQQWGLLWQAQLAPDDQPLVWWSAAHEAWVRTLAGDRLTAEQLLSDAPDRLSRELGERHPYTRSARLALAATLQARGAHEQAASLRTEAERAVRELFRGAGRGPELLDGVPAPPGVLAHVSPNPPMREGFRAGRDGGFLAPLTSVQRLIAGRDGWRLHLLADGACRTSVVVGNVPRRITVDAARTADHRWLVQIHGTNPTASMIAAPADVAHVSLIANSPATLRARVGDETRTLTIATHDPPDPPYALEFADDGSRRSGGGLAAASASGLDAVGCAVVWLEIAFPYHPGAKVAQPPPSQ